MSGVVIFLLRHIGAVSCVHPVSVHNATFCVD